MSMIKLLGLRISVYTRIARLALEEKDVDYQLEEVDIFADAIADTALSTEEQQNALRVVESIGGEQAIAVLRDAAGSSDKRLPCFSAAPRYIYLQDG